METTIRKNNKPLSVNPGLSSEAELVDPASCGTGKVHHYNSEIILIFFLWSLMIVLSEKSHEGYKILC